MRKQTTERVEKLYHGRLRIEKRNGSPILSARAYLQGRLVRKSTGETSKAAAIKVATDWYLEQLDRVRKGENIHGHRTLFSEAYRAFLKHAKGPARKVTPGQIKNYEDKWNLFEKTYATYFDGLTVHDMDLEWLERFRDERAKSVNKRGEPISNSTLKKDADFLRLVLRHAVERMKVLKELPTFPSFDGREWAVEKKQRPFFTYEEWQILRTRAKRRMDEEGLNSRHKRQRQELYCLIMICVGGALRVEEAQSLRWRDCTEGIVDDADKTPCVHIRVYGKHARTKQRRELGWLIYDGVTGYRLWKSLNPDAKPDDRLFQCEDYLGGFKELMLGDKDFADMDLREVLIDDKVETRSLRSLRQTGISMRLDLGPDPSYRDIAKWARTKATHIEDFYDQTHAKESVKRITGFRRPKISDKAAASLAQAQKSIQQNPIELEPWELDQRDAGGQASPGSHLQPWELDQRDSVD